MKKLTKTLIALGCVATLSAGVCAMAACGSAKNGEAYGLTNGADSIGYVTITVEGDKITALTLSEVQFPNVVEAPATVAEADKVTVTIDQWGTEVEKSYYKTVSFGSETMTYDAATKEYKVGTKTFEQYFATEANCKAYYEAVMGNQISVTIGTEKKTDIMTKALLSKEENGYWKSASGSKVDPVEGKTFWMVNRDATVKFAMENGVAALANLTRADANDQHSFWMSGTVSTGATWTCLGTAAKGITYATLITNAYNAAK